MKAAVYNNIIKKLELAEIPKPKISNGGAIIKVLGCGLCGSDMVKIALGLAETGAVFGHEVVGIIEQIDTKTDFKQGDRIILGHHVPCYECVFCKGESYSMCREFKASNIIPGGFCEYIYVSERHLENTVNLVPEEMPDMLAVFTEPAACCLRAVRRSGLKAGNNALIVGLGTIGMLIGQILESVGVQTKGLDIMIERIELAEKLGIKSLEKDDERFDCVFLCAGSPKTIQTALEKVRDGGSICVFASVKDDMAAFSNNQVYYRDLTVFGSYSPASSDLKDALKMLSDGKIKTEELICEYSLENINQAIEDTFLNRIMKAYIKINKEK